MLNVDLNPAIETNLPGTFTQTHLRKRVTAVTYEDVYDGLHDTYASASHYTYDIHGNVNSLLQENQSLGILLDPLTQGGSPLMTDNQRFKRMDYSYDLISGNVHEVRYQYKESDQFIHRYEYDADNRIVQVKTTKDEIIWDTDAEYFYYDHGPLARVEIGDNNVQGIDYAYTLQGSLKGLNSDALTSARDMGHDGLSTSVNAFFAQDVFSFSLGYYTGDYHPIDITTPQFLSEVPSNSDFAL